MTLVVVGSRNPSKISGTLKAFRRFYRNVTVEAVKPPEGLPPQPVGLEQTILGALVRASHAIDQVPDAEYGVGVEAGFIPFPSTITGYVDVQVAAVVDAERRVTVGTCQGFEFPYEAVDRVVKGEARESEEVIVELTGIEGIGDKMGAIGYLTKNVILREDLTFQAVVSALIPRINHQLYRVEWPRVEEVISRLEDVLTSRGGSAHRRAPDEP